MINFCWLVTHLLLPLSQQPREIRDSIVPGPVPLCILVRWPCKLHLWLPGETDMKATCNFKTRDGTETNQTHPSWKIAWELSLLSSSTPSFEEFHWGPVPYLANLSLHNLLQLFPVLLPIVHSVCESEPSNEESQCRFPHETRPVSVLMRTRQTSPHQISTLFLFHHPRKRLQLGAVILHFGNGLMLALLALAGGC